MSLFPYQQRIVDSTYLESYWGYFLDPGLGKTRITLAVAERLFHCRLINGMLIISPNMIHRSWTKDELPKASSPFLPSRAWTYDSGQCHSLTKAMWKTLSPDGSEQSILSMTYDAICTKQGYDIAKQYLQTREVLLVLDESSRIKNPKALRTKRALSLAQHTPYKRILSGTPIHNSPLDLYSQMQALALTFWKERGYGSFTAFRAHFACLKKRTIYRNGRQVSFQEVTGYRHLDELAKIVAEKSTRLTKAAALPDLPPLVVATRTFTLSSEQCRVYDELKRECLVQIDSHLVTVQQAIAMLTRLQQLASGFGVDTDGREFDLPDNSRLDFLEELLQDSTEQAVIFAKFDHTVDSIVSRIGGSVRLDGRTPEKERQSILNDFRAGKFQFLVTKQRVGGFGLNLQNATTCYVVEQEWSHGDLEQAKNRIHRIGIDGARYVVNLCADGTIDEKILSGLTIKDGYAKMFA